jgi:nucleoside phosphorylase
MEQVAPPSDRAGFEIAIICATRLEADAVEAMFDKVWDRTYGRAPGDTNAYTTGVIGHHNTVLAYMPGTGKSAAASVAASCRSSFVGIRLALVVGICGGVPSGSDNKKEILLGDVIISRGIVQYDLGRRWPNRFIRKDTLSDNLGRPNTEIRSYIAKLTARMGRKQLREKMLSYLEALLKEPDFAQSQFPGMEADKLFEATYHHKHRQIPGASTCACSGERGDEVCSDALESLCSVLGCDEKRLIPRTRLITAREDREPPKPAIHYGIIASGDTVMKSGEDRDEIARAEKVVGFEMEGVGVWDVFPCVVIKGVCDYADSHKDKVWQEYAAASAASCMKAFLEKWERAVHTGM